MSGSGRNTWDTVFSVLFYLACVVGGVGLFIGLTAHPHLAAAWALLATAGTGVLAYRHAELRNTARIRAAAEAHRHRRQALDIPGGPTVADVLTSYRSGRLIGDAERDVIVGALHTHFAAGRLTPAELDERLGAALGARTVDDLSRAVEGLPSEVSGR